MGNLKTLNYVKSSDVKYYFFKQITCLAKLKWQSNRNNNDCLP